MKLISIHGVILCIALAGCSDEGASSPDNKDMSLKDVGSLSDVRPLLDLSVGDARTVDAAKRDAAVPEDMGLTSDMKAMDMGDSSCDSGKFINPDKGMCELCPTLDWNCSALEKVMTFDMSSNVFTFNLGSDGYEKAILRGSNMTISNAQPFEIEASVKGSAAVFDLDSYASSAEVLLLSFEVFSRCDATQETSLNIKWTPSQGKVGAAFCL